MDRLRAFLLVSVALFERERGRLVEARRQLRGSDPMTGEIRDALSKFKTAHARMTTNIVAEMEKATASVPEVEKEGIAAVKLPAAMLEATRAEIREITSEFAGQTNGPPPGPLPGSSATSSPAVEPAASWSGSKTS